MKFTGNANYLRYVAKQQEKFEEFRKSLGMLRDESNRPYLRDLTSKQIRRAAELKAEIEKLETELRKSKIHQQLEKLQRQLAAVLKVKGKSKGKVKGTRKRGRKNKMSKEGRAKIAAAQKKRRQRERENDASDGLL